MGSLLALLLLQGSTAAVLEPVPPGTLRVYFVRHGQSVSNLKPTGHQATGALDHLTPLGRQQSTEAGKALGGLIQLVLSSPANRARESARDLARAAGGVRVRVEPRLRPMTLGRGPDGAPLTWPQRLAEWTAGRDPQPTEGESFAQVAARVQGLFERLRAERGGRAVAVVAHSEVIGAYLAPLRPQHTPPALERIDNGTLSLVDVAPAGAATVVFLNHLPAEVSAPAAPGR